MIIIAFIKYTLVRKDNDKHNKNVRIMFMCVADSNGMHWLKSNNLYLINNFS